MTANYLNICRMPSYAARLQTEYRLNPGDGFKGLPFRPSWS
jgi:hypothetical protein